MKHSQDEKSQRLNKLTIISGTPRSGTSSMSLNIKHAVGEDNFMGAEFPQENKTKFSDRLKNIKDNEVREYYMEKYKVHLEKEREQIDKEPRYKDMNPKGFHECKYSVQGIKWHDNFPDLTGKYCKIVSGGVAKSNPDYIDKIIFMARCPRQVAKSQERLKRNIPDGEIIHSPEMFVRGSIQFAKWVLINGKEDDVIVINYDKLIENASKELNRVANFIGVPFENFDPTLIDPNLQRSKPQDIPHHMWDVADNIYQAMLVSNWKKILELGTESRKIINRDNTRTQCERLNEMMFYNECTNCIHNKSTRNTFKKRAESNGIDWKSKPCMFLCSTSPDIEHTSLKETIENNHWADDNFVPPTKTQIAKDALQTLGRVAKDKMKGKKILARKDVVDQRREICNGCNMKKGDRCKKCTCKIEKKIKIVQSKCPLGKW